MRDQVIMQDICFIRADPDRPVYYYCAAAPSVQVAAGNQPDVQLQIFRNLNQPDDLYATLSFADPTGQFARSGATRRRRQPGHAARCDLIAAAGHRLQRDAEYPRSYPRADQQNLAERPAILLPVRQTERRRRYPAAGEPDAHAGLDAIAVSYKIDYLQQLPPATFELEANWDPGLPLPAALNRF